MTSGFASGYKMESGEARALRSINTESYDYRDQGKLLTKLTSDVTYMAQYMRTMQKGIDDANANFIEQIGDFVNEIIVVIGGGGNTGFDFGDLKYVLQAIGALFGFDEQTGIASIFPINLFNAAWHFFSTYILPLNNFGDAVDNFIDSAMATILDVLGEIPIVGQGVQILATWISDLRDGVTGINQSLDDTIDDLTQLISDLWTNPAATIQTISQNMVTGLNTSLTNLNTFIQDVIDNIIGALSGIPIIGGAISAISTNIKALFQNLFRQDTPKNTVDAAAVPALDGAKIQSGSVAADRIADLNANKITAGSFADARIPNLNASKINAGTFGGTLIPNLDGSKILTGTLAEDRIASLSAGKITSGSFADARIPNLNASKVNAGTFLDTLIPSLNANKITAGTFGGTLIPNLDGSKILTGTMAQDRVVNLGTDLAARRKLADTANIAVDPSYELNVETLFTGTCTRDTVDGIVRSGTASIKYVSNASTTSRVYVTSLNSTRRHQCSGSDVFYVKMWIQGKGSTNTANTTGTFQIYAGAYTAANVFIQWVSGPVVTLTTALNDTWVEVAGYITVPATCRQFELFGQFQNVTGIPSGYTYYVDDVVLKEVTESNVINKSLFNSNNPLAAILSGIIPNLDGSKINTGTLAEDRIASLSAGKITTGSFADARIPNLNASKINAGTFLDTLIPGLNASKITGGIFGGTLIPNLDGSKILTGTLAEDRIASLSATKITTGTFLDSLIPNLNATKINAGTFLDTLIPNLNASKITAGTFGGTLIPNLDGSKILTGTLAEDRIASLSAGKITTGTFLDSLIPNLNATKINAGTFLDTLIPNLNASKINAGTFVGTLIPNLDGSKILTGSLAQDRVMNLGTDLTTARDLARGSLTSGSNIVSNPGFESTNFFGGTNFVTTVKRTGLRSARITADGTNYGVVYVTSDNTGFLAVPVVPNDIFYVEAYVLRAGTAPTTGSIWIQADIYNSAGTAIGYPNNGQVAATSISTTASAWTKISGYITMPPNAASASFMVVVGNTVTSGAIFYFDDVVVKEYTYSAQINTALYSQNTPQSSILAGVIPNLDGSKILSGTLAEDRIASLSAGKITTGTFLDSLIPNLNATKINAGTFLDTLIPNLNASKITAGTFGGTLIPNLDGSKILTGTLAEDRIASLSAGKITSGTFADTRIPILAQSKITSLTTDLSNRVDYSAYQSFLSGGSGNICTNPGFEDTTQYLWGGVLDTTIKRSGSRSAKLSGGANVYIALASNKTGEVSVSGKANQKFYLEMWVYGDSGNTVVSASNSIYIGIWIYDAAGAGVTGSQLLATNPNAIGKGSWVKVSGIVTLPNDSAIRRARPLIHMNTNVTSGNTYYFDDVVVKEITESAETNRALYNADVPGQTILTGAVPGLDAAKVTTGTFPNAMIASGLDAAKLTTGTLPIARIAAGAVDNTKIASGVDAAKLTTGTLPIARIADSAITTAKIGDSQITGVKTAGLDGSKITGGSIAENLVQNLTPTRTDVQNTFNKLAGVLTNGEDNVTGSVIDNVVAALLKTYNTLQDHSADLQSLKAEKASAQVKGAVFNINFSDYSNGQFSTTAAPGTNTFFVTYSGAGTSLLGVQGGVAQWYSTNNADRNALLIWNKPTNTDFQIISGTMTTPPVQPAGGAGTPKFHAVARCNSTGNTYLWARAYCDGFLSFKGEIGCTVNGVETQWANNIPLTWSLDMKFVVGVGTNSRQYQVYSGSTLVWTHTESGTANVNYTTKTSTSAVQSTLGASNRQWGALAQIRGGTNGPYHSGKVGATSVSDNQTPQVNGSVARMDRTSTTAVTYTGGGATTVIPNSFFNVIDYESPDIDADTTTGSFTVTESKAYIVTGRVITGNVAAWGTLILQMWNGTAWVNAQFGNPIYTQDGVAALYGQWIQYLNAGEKVRLAYERAGITTTSLNGEATGTKTYFAIAGTS